MEQEAITTHRIFVYGTLMKGGRNEFLMDNARLITEEAVTKESSFLMRQFDSSSSKGKFSPATIRGGQGYIQGEVYEVDNEGLKALDELEGNGIHYQREEIWLDDNSKAWMYILLRDDTPSKEQDRIHFDESSKNYSWRREEPSI